jgi:hypothetical protein
MIDPITWGQDLLTNDSPCIHDFDLFINEIQKMYGEMDCKLNAGTRLYHEIRKCHHDPDESVRAYAIRLRRNWREAGWDEEQQMLSCYHTIWAGVKPDLHRKISPFHNEDGMFDSSDELFDQAADVETKPQKYDKSQQPRQYGETIVQRRQKMRILTIHFRIEGCTKGSTKA